MMTDVQKLEMLQRHIRNVQENCQLMADVLIQAGRFEIARKLLANSMLHDNSKFTGIEWEYLDPTTTNKTGLKYAITHHHSTNLHHPEYWGHISKMPDIYLAECVADWKARSEEQGTNMREWIDAVAIKRYKFNKGGEIDLRINAYTDMVCTKPFVPLDDILPVEAPAVTMPAAPPVQLETRL